MGLSQAGLVLVATLVLGSPLVTRNVDDKLHALYLMQQNQIEEALQSYRESFHASGRQDFDILQQMALLMLKKGIQSHEPQAFLMTLFGAGFSGNLSSLEILEKGLDHPDPQVQLLALHFIAQFDDDRTYDIFNRAMSSDYLSTRMEAAFCMAQRKHPLAVGQIEGLMFRLPPVFKPYFPSFFALLGTTEATAALRRLAEDVDPQVRVESILHIAKLGRDDFLPMLRKRLTHTHIAELEATLFAVGLLQDNGSLAKIRKHTQSPTDSIRLAASMAQLQLGDRSSVKIIEELALKHNLFAISCLGQIPGTEETLASLIESHDLQVRINAGVGLLQRHDSRCLKVLEEILIEDARVLAFHPYPTVGRSMNAWKAVPAADLRTNEPSVDFSLTLAFREHVLRETIHLPESSFIALARLIFDRGQTDLVPTLIGLLENLRSTEAIKLLKEGTSKQKSPLIRDYCHLALFRLKEEGPHEEFVMKWIMSQKGSDLIRLHPLLPWKFRMEQTDYMLTPEETSRLLIESFLSIANRRDEKSISFLLEAIQLGNPDNRYALMGLLMRATE